MAPEENALFLSFLSRLESARYRRDFCDQAESFFRELASMLSSRRVPRRRQVIEEVRRYIGEHHQRLSHPPADAVRSPAALHRPVPGV